MDIATEIRKLPYSNVKVLAHILDPNESWKNLMAIIPKNLEKDNYECDISRSNPCKYHSEHFKLLENASITLQKMCTELLFSEWGTSAKIRPALGHLLYLLTKAQLFRAAEYVAETLLNREPPVRPTQGPAAIVTINMPDINMQELEKELNAQKYHSSIMFDLMDDTSNNVDVNINYNRQENNNMASIPKILISDVQMYDSSIVMPVVHESRRRRLNRQHASIVDEPTNNELSDLMKFPSSEIVSDTNNESSNEDSVSIIPDISAIMNSNSDNPVSESCLPKLTCFNMKSDSTTESDISVPSSGNLPLINDLLEDGSKSKELSSLEPLHSELIVPNFSILGLNQQSELIPSMSLLNNSSNTETFADKKPPVTINIQPESFAMPQFSALLSDKKSFSGSDSKHFLPIADPSSDASSYGSSKNSSASSEMSQRSDSRPKCVSPLPNLSLNTPLPHFCYDEVETATNSFDETPHGNSCKVENPLAESSGRFLGFGAFGSVFLGLNIVDKPVAVKKLFLNNMDVVDVDDPVTKQFKNEVEVLSKYQHENLLSLIGYSCDGPTYCLLYEFMAGGALKDRLQNTEERLIWTDRLYIALGTARAVSYLHTAYSTPLIHRDIKTANILLDCTNKPKLCDFGLIKLLGNQNTNTSTSAFGTSAYMAREAFRGDVSVKLDTYSFGVVLLELVTGLPPLDENREGCDIVTHVEEVCEDDSIAPLTDLKAGSWLAKDINFAEELYKISIKCLEQNKKKRPTMVGVTKELADLIKQCA